MWFNPYLAERLAEERVRDAMYEAQQARLIRMAKGPGKSREWRPRVTLILSSLLGLVIRPQG